jgi:hypothetical protein
VDPVGNCEDRCYLSSADPQYREVTDCAANADCRVVAACLHAAFPDTPVTGVSRVVLLSTGGLAASPDAGALGGCSPDAGSQLSFARAFVEEWGARQYSEQVACELPLRQSFENVPAARAVRVGFQIAQDGACAEYATAVDIAAGQDPLSVTLNLDAAPSQCAPDQPAAAEGGAPDGGGIDP